MRGRVRTSSAAATSFTRSGGRHSRRVTHSGSCRGGLVRSQRVTAGARPISRSTATASSAVAGGGRRRPWKRSHSGSSQAIGCWSSISTTTPRTGGRGQGAQERRQVDDVVQHVVRHYHVRLPRFRRRVGPLAEARPGQARRAPGRWRRRRRACRAAGRRPISSVARSARANAASPPPQPTSSTVPAVGRASLSPAAREGVSAGVERRHEPRRIVVPRVPVDAGPDLRRDSPPGLQLGPPLRRTAVRHVSSVERAGRRRTSRNPGSRPADDRRRSRTTHRRGNGARRRGTELAGMKRDSP